MILNLERFQAQAKPRWQNLELLLGALESRPDRRLNSAEAHQLQELYAHAAVDLNRVTHGALAPELRQYLERLVARAYAELYYAPPTRSAPSAASRHSRDRSPRTPSAARSSR